MEWFSQKLFLKSKGKIKYVLGTTPVLALEDSSFKTWDAENSMVMSWLLLFHSMKLEISKIYLLMTTTKEICGAVTQTYSKLGITGKLYPCHKTRILYCQCTLKEMWLELDIYQDRDGVYYKYKEAKKIYWTERGRESLNSWSNSIHNMIE